MAIADACSNGFCPAATSTLNDVAFSDNFADQARVYQGYAKECNDIIKLQINRYRDECITIAIYVV